MEILTEDELAQILPSFDSPRSSLPPEDSLSFDPPDEETGAECSFCGWCPNPEHCVWSVECPICGSPPREHCVQPENRATTALHEERWQLVKQLHGVYYVTN